MQIVTTPCGDIPATGRAEYGGDGSLRGVTPCEQCALKTPLGAYVPQFRTDDLRKKMVLPVTFHDNGALKNLPLEERSTVVTPAGTMSAEMLTFHANGAVHRVFPLNGQLSGYWTQEDETGLLEPTVLETPLGRIEARVLCACFYDDGALKSLTLWPGETMEAATPAGTMSIRIGVAFWHDGSVRSVEPAEPSAVATPVGDIRAFDPDAVGVNGDVNSLAFAPDGTVSAVATVQTRLMSTDGKGDTRVFTPASRESYCSEAEQEPVPMRLSFAENTVIVCTDPDLPPEIIDFTQCGCHTSPHLPMLEQAFHVPIACGI